MNRKFNVAFLVIFFAAGLFLRLRGLNWDQSQHQHPDERFMTMVVAELAPLQNMGGYFNTAQSTLNPYNRGFPTYVYGTLPLFTTWLLGRLTGLSDYGHVFLVGRVLSAVMDTITIMLVFLIGRRLYGERAGVIAAALWAFCVMAIQQAHFFTVDSMAVALITASLLLALRVESNPTLKNGLWLGFCFGLALASRINLMPFLLVIFLAWLPLPLPPRSQWRVWVKYAAGLLATIAATVVIFRIAQPYAFDGPGFLNVSFSTQWLQDIKNVWEITNGAADVPFTRLWANRLNFAYPWLNMVQWGMGWPLGLAAWVGTGWALVRIAFYRERKNLLLVAWVITLFLYHGRLFNMTLRYFLPIYPALILLASYWLQEIKALVVYRPCMVKRAAACLPWLLVFATACWAWGFTRIYRQPHSRITASQWIYQNLPKHSVLVSEHWDDSLPLHLDGMTPDTHGYELLELPWYEEDNPEKLSQVLALLERADYLILSSNRLYDSIPRSPHRYPMTCRYYQHLFNGDMGFDRIAEFTSYPALLFWTIPDQVAEEAFHVYDHPRIQIFAKNTQWSAAHARQLLTNGVDWAAIMRPVDRFPSGTAISYTFSPQLWKLVQAGGTWSRLFNRHDWANRQPVLVWVICLELIGWLAFPIVSLASPRLLDRGFMLSKFVGVLLIGYAAWILASLQWAFFTRQTMVLLGLLLGFVSCWVIVRQPRHFRVLLAHNWKNLLCAEGLFWLVFLVFLMIRAGNPDLWHPWRGGEKPIDYGMFNAAIKSVIFPLYDHWFAGDYVNYYYFGVVLAAVPTKLTGIVPAVAHNLVIPTWAAFTAAGAFSLAAFLSQCFLPAARQRLRVMWVAGLMAIFLVLFCGNLAEWTYIFKQLPPEDWYWSASRAIPAPPSEAGPITEFPYFTFLFADLHPHLLAFPIVLLSITLCSQYLVRPRAMMLSLLALATGALHPTHAWDYPTCMLIVAGTFGVLAWQKQFAWSWLIRYGCYAVAVLVLGKVLYWPFYQHYFTPPGGFQPWTGSRTPWPIWLVLFGIFMIPLLGGLSKALMWRKSLPTGGGPLRLFYLLLVLLGLFLLVFVEYVALSADIGRMNTVFKFHLQIWLLWGTTTAAITPFLFYPLLAPAAHPVFTRWERWVRYASVGLWLAALYYPLRATPARWADRFNPQQGWGLDGTSFMKNAMREEDGQWFEMRWDLKTMHWLQNNVTGTPVIVEAHRPEYHWGARISNFCGLPTVIGWNWHERQHRIGRPGEEVEARIRDVHELYRTTDANTAKALLRRYGVRFVIVGPLERAVYPVEGLQKFDAREQTNYWRIVYENPVAKVLEVVD